MHLRTLCRKRTRTHFFSPLESVGYALFWQRAPGNSFRFSRFRTLCKRMGGGGAFSLNLKYYLISVSKLQMGKKLYRLSRFSRRAGLPARALKAADAPTTEPDESKSGSCRSSAPQLQTARNSPRHRCSRLAPDCLP